MSKQTAVEWLLYQLEQKRDMRETPSIRNLQLNIDTSDYLDLKRQAQAMEKEQIKDAYDAGFGSMDDVKDRMYKQYYNETYGGDE